MKRSVLIVFVIWMVTHNLFAQERAPGTDIIGYGYNIFGEYANQKSKKKFCLFKYGNYANEMVGNKQFSVPMNVIFENISDHKTHSFSGESIREYASSLSAKVNMKVDAFLFKGSVNSSYDTQSSGSEKRFYYTYMDANTKWRISLDIRGGDVAPLREMLDPRFANDVDNMLATTLFQTYGTHYIASAYLGGRAEYNSETVMSESTNTSAVSVAVEAEYKAVSGNGSLDTNNKLTLSNSQTKRTLRVVGGNSEFANNIHDRETYMKWAEGISPMPVLCDFDETSLRPIWEFATSLERRQELEYAFKKILALDENKLPVELASTGMMADNYYFIRPASSNTDYWDLPWYHWDAQTKSAKIGLAPKDNLNDKNPRQGADRFIKIIPSSTPGMVYFQPQHSLFVADITGGVKEPGAELQLWDKGEGNKAQLFMMIEVPGIKNGYNIQSQASGLFLTANGTGKSITQQQKTEGQNQIWIFEKADAIKEMAPPPNGIRVGFKNLKGNRYIDVPGKPDNTNFKGKTIQLWDLDENPDRYFFLEEANHDEAWYMITSLAANLTWDVQGGVKNANTAIQMWDKNRSGAQMFTFEYAGTPRQYYIRNVNSGRLIEADNSSVMANGCKITQTTTGKGSNDNQKWELTNTGSTWFMPPANQNFFIRCAYSNQYWDIPGRGGETTANGVGFKLWDLSDEDGDRKFKIVPAGQDSWVNIVPQNGGKFVTIPANSRDEGTKLCLWTKESNSQMFAIYPTSPVTFTIRTNNWYAIDVAGGDYRKKGSDLCQWGLHYGPNQQFVLIFADGPNKGKALVFF